MAAVKISFTELPWRVIALTEVTLAPLPERFAATTAVELTVVLTVLLPMDMVLLRVKVLLALLNLNAADPFAKLESLNRMCVLLPAASVVAGSEI